MEKQLHIAQILLEFLDIKRILDEKGIRWWCACRARSYNRIYIKGGVSIVSEATGISRSRIYKGLEEIAADSVNSARIRKQGGGRKKNNREAI